MEDLVTTDPVTIEAGGEPAPAAAEPADPAPSQELDPSISFTEAGRDALSRWLAEDEDEDGDDDPVAEEVTTQPEGEPAPAQEGAAPPAPEEPNAEEEQSASPATPEEGAPASAESKKPKRSAYTALVDAEEWTPPEGLKLRYRAEGREREYDLDEVVRLAQLGENYGRRSRELHERQQKWQEEAQRQYTAMQQQYAAQVNELLETARRFAEDVDFREQFLEEYEKLQSDPEEYQLRVRAQQADLYEQQIAAQRQQQAELLKQQQTQWQRQMWQTVDEVIRDLQQDYPYADASRVRGRWHQAYLRDPEGATSEAFLSHLMREEHEMVARHVEAERAKIRQQFEAEKAVEKMNRATDQAIERDRVARTVPTTGLAPQPGRRSAPKTYEEGAKALRDWANAP